MSNAPTWDQIPAALSIFNSRQSVFSLLGADASFDCLLIYTFHSETYGAARLALLQCKPGKNQEKL